MTARRTRKPSKARIAKVAAIARKNDESRAGTILATVFSAKEERAMFVTKSGLLSVEDTKENPVDRKEVIDFLRYKRAFGTAEVLEEVGIAWLRYMERSGYVVADSDERNADGLCRTGYFITEKAIETYSLPTRDAFGRKIMFLHAIKAYRSTEMKQAA